MTGEGLRGDELDDVDRRALATFVAGSAMPRFAPVLVLVAAYREEATIGAVLDEVPSQCEGLAVDRLVVVDGGADATGAVARAHGAFVCECDENRGQGAALRLGYALARAGGARFVVTTDADGQYDGRELPRLVGPVRRDEADFVTGSRWLGTHQDAPLARRLGSRVFAWVATRLSGQRITDTSFGFRALRAELTAEVTLRQPQYQSAELLLEVLGRGYRVLEVPMTMRARRSGRSKKGSSLRFGLAYSRSVASTWWRLRTVRAARAARWRPASGPSPGREEHPVEEQELGDEEAPGDQHERAVDHAHRGPV